MLLEFSGTTAFMLNLTFESPLNPQIGSSLGGRQMKLRPCEVSSDIWIGFDGGADLMATFLGLC